jgi:anti-sigma factor RsiW
MVRQEAHGQGRDVHRVWDAFVDGYTDVPTPLELQAHLEQCWRCQHALELEYRMRQLLTAPGLGEHAPPHLRRQMQRLTVRRWVLRSLAGVALVLLGLALVWRLMGPTRSPPSHPGPALGGDHADPLRTEHHGHSRAAS